MKKIEINSPAKINLFLKVKEKNQDGYHNIDTSFQLIDLFDYMSFEVSDKSIVIKSNESFLELEEMLMKVGYLLEHTSFSKIRKFKKYIWRTVKTMPS